MSEKQQLAEMKDAELVAYWNILNAPTINVDPDGKIERHKPIVSQLLTERNIPHEEGKRTKSSKEVTDGSLDHLIYDERSPRP